MSKKITLGVIGFIGVGILFLAPAAHAATTGPDQQTRALLGQTLNVLQATLDQIDARIGAKTIENPAMISASLDSIKSSLVVLDTYLRGTAPVATGNNSPLGEALPETAGQVIPQTATVSWFVGSKLLLIILPIAVLLLVVFVFMRKKKPEETKPAQSPAPQAANS